MKTSWMKNTALALAIFVLLYVLCVGINLLFPQISYEDGAVKDYDGEIHLLSFQKVAPRAYAMRLSLEGDCPEIALLLGRMPERLEINGVEAELSEAVPVAVGIIGLRLDEQRIAEGGGRLELRVVSKAQAAPSIFLSGIHQMIWLNQLCTSVKAFVLGILMIMAVYGFSLYCCKRSETYLFLFASYVGMLFLWMLPSVFDAGELFRYVEVYMYDSAIVMSLLMCVQLFEPNQAQKSRVIHTWYGALGISLSVGTLFSLLALPYSVTEIIRFLAYLVESVFLLAECVKGKRECWVILTGLLFSQAVRLVVIEDMYPLMHLSLFWLLVKHLRLGILVYVASCMIFINRRFARKYGEAEELARYLDRKVQERTEEVIHQQTRLHNFVTNIFHDLRTPLFIMKGCLEQLEDGGNGEDALRIAKERLKFMTGLVDQLFIAMKLEDGNMLMETEPFDLSNVLRRALSGVSLERENQAVQIQGNIDPGLMIWGDERQIEQAFQNLIINAIYYAAQRVCVEAHCEDRFVVVRVSDDGIGLPEDEQKKIFDRYYAVSGQKKHNSSGLGLSIAQSVISMHKGRLTVESEPGKGTTFCARLPIWK